MKKILLIAVLCVFQLAIAQEDALVFFNEKPNVTASLANPISILTQDAIDRKQLHGTPIDERDVPVDESYIDTVEAQPGITVYAKSKWMNSVYVRGSQSQIDALLDLSFVSDVEYMDKSLNFAPGGNGTAPDKFAIENETNRINYDYGAALNQTEMISVDFLHQQDFTGEGMVVAVLDSGFPGVFSNPAFADAINEDRIIDTYDFVTRQVNADGSGSHGSRTFSDIAGLLDGDFVGTAPQASYYLYVTEEGGAENPVEEAYWVEALERADSLGVDVINTSLGYQDFDDSSYNHQYEDLDGQTTISARGANHALDKGMLLVTSAGNDGNGFGHVATPADSPGVFTVGAVDSNENYASFSSYGPTFDGRIKPDVMAQGQSAAVIDQNGNVDFNNGTSFSSPIIAGAIASLWQSKPEATNVQIMQIVREASHLFNSPTDQMGYGIPNFEDAYNALQVLGVEDQMLASQFAMYPNPAINSISFSIPSFVIKANVEIFTITGQQVMTSEISATNNTINIDNLASGMYVARVISKDISNTFKLIKK